jgi:hypothetical protein
MEPCRHGTAFVETAMMIPFVWCAGPTGARLAFRFAGFAAIEQSPLAVR